VDFKFQRSQEGLNLLVKTVMRRSSTLHMILTEAIPTLSGLGLARLAFAVRIFILLDRWVNCHLVKPTRRLPINHSEKEISHVMDDHRYFSNTVASRLFRPESQFKISAHRQLDSHSNRYRRHTPRTELTGGGVNHSQRRNIEPFIKTRCF
jgi:hypothetical protein